MSYKYVVLGGGNASGYAAREFVACGVGKDELCIITDEPAVAYERPALSKGFLALDGGARLPGFHTCVGSGGERQEPSWYADKGIKYLTNSKVVEVDPKAKTLKLADGSSIQYGKLIFATGARAVTLADFKAPGADLAGIFSLRNVADGEALLAGIRECKAAGKGAVVVGGGYIGMEVAAGLANNGVAATIVMPDDRLLARLFNAELAGFYERFYEAKGVKFVRGATVTGFEGGADGKVSSVVYRTKDGSSVKLECGMAVVGVGARPNVELLSGKVALADAPVGGVKVDGFMRTSDPDIYAVGDVAAFPLKMQGGALVRQEHVTHCRSSAALAVQHIMGKAPSEYDYLPFFYSRVFSLSWQFYGQAEGSPLVFGDMAANKFGAYFVKAGKVVGAFLESGSPEENKAVQKLAREQPQAPAAEELVKLGLGFATARL